MLAIWRKASSLARRWADAHVPMVVKPGAYDQVADDLDKALTATPGSTSSRARRRRRCRCPPTGSPPLPAGRQRRSSPTGCSSLRGKDLDILIYPMDILISGKPDAVTRARAAMASRLTTVGGPPDGDGRGPGRSRTG